MFIAHRGESFDSPENTLSSINLAWANGVKAIEIDIRQTKDKEIVVIHDKDTCRVSQNCLIVKKSTLSQLKSLDVGSFKGDKWKNERIPTLKEVLITIPKDGKLIIEIKSSKEILEKLTRDLSQSGLDNNQLEIIAFDLKTLIEAKKRMPQYKMHWLLKLDYYLPCWLVFIKPERVIRKLKKYNLDGINVWSGKMLNENFIHSFKNAGLLIYAWTVNNIEVAKTLVDNGIDGVTSDRASWMAKSIDLEIEKNKF